MTDTATVDAFRDHVPGEIRIYQFEVVLDALDHQTGRGVGAHAEALPSDVDQLLGVDEHAMIDRRVPVGDGIRAPVIPHGLHKMLHPDLVPDEVDRYRGRDAQQLDPEELGPAGAVLTAVDLVQAHHTVCLAVRGELAGLAQQVHVGQFCDVDSHDWSPIKASTAARAASYASRPSAQSG